MQSVPTENKNPVVTSNDQLMSGMMKDIKKQGQFRERKRENKSILQCFDMRTVSVQ